MLPMFPILAWAEEKKAEQAAVAVAELVEHEADLKNIYVEIFWDF